MESFLHYFFEKFSWFILKWYCRLEFNEINLPNEPFIVCSNHNSHLDTPCLMLALNKRFSQFVALAARDHFDTKKKKLFDIRRMLNLIYVDRGASLPEMRRLINECKLAKKSQKNLIIYPEGTRSNSDELQSFKLGCAFIAYKLQMPIVPAAIRGTFSALPKNKSFIKPKKIRVHFGDVIDPRLQNYTCKHQAIAEITMCVENTIKDLMRRSQLNTEENCTPLVSHLKD